MIDKRGFYYYTPGADPKFIEAVKIVKFADELEKILQYDKEAFINGVCEVVANYDINDVYVWVDVTAGKHANISWGTTPIVKPKTLSNEAIRAAYWVWQQASCTPEEASKVLNISMNELMLLAEQFAKLDH
jgi:hypothetical protein